MRWPTALEEATAATSDTAAATTNNEQKIRRNCDDADVRSAFLIIQFHDFSWLPGMNAGARLLIKSPAACQHFPEVSF